MTAHSCLRNSPTLKRVFSDASAATWIHLHYYLPVKLASWEIYSCTVWSKTCSSEPRCWLLKMTGCADISQYNSTEAPICCRVPLQIHRVAKWRAFIYLRPVGRGGGSWDQALESPLTLSGADVFPISFPSLSSSHLKSLMFKHVTLGSDTSPPPPPTGGSGQEVDQKGRDGH